ncbi:maltoporin LamB [Vibrio sinaloensis]|uniref:maltoporin LamB n=1 Tax=Photobacterium sp. (strain ATCC 43367) TaxID=379097 RepID=UPI00205F96EA|nr:maltoporin LamB [Vibrio sinaloensis]UPQ89537.1 maltoporin LamB [Vibrio sinaloensis]
MKKVSVIAAAVAATLAAGSAFAVDFNGYMRAGTGISANSGSDVSVNKNGIGRLGNENDNYSEFGFAEELKTGEQTWRLESMIAAGRDGKKGWEDGDVNIAQFAVKAKGVLAFDRDATLWAGKTYYQRKDIHITDFYFLNTSGTGGGIENISLGNQKLSLALLQDNGSQKVDTTDVNYKLTDAAAASIKACNGNPGCIAAIEGASGSYVADGFKTKDEEVNGFIFDARLANIGLWEDASLELALAYNFAAESNGQTAKADDGLLATAVLHQGMSNGFNQTVLQYGTNGYGVQAANFWGAGAYYDRSGDQNGAKGYRVINWGVMNLGESWEMGHQLAYLAGADIGTSKLDIDQYSVVARPMYKWNDTMRTIFEAGYNAGEKINKAGTAVEDFGNTKFTVAQAWAMGDSFWARPEIRVYGSYISDLENKDAFGTGKDNEFVAGIQVEAWW